MDLTRREPVATALRGGFGDFSLPGTEEAGQNNGQPRSPLHSRRDLRGPVPPGDQEDKKKPGDDLLSHHEGSTIGVRELNFRVRNGNGCGLSTIITGQYLLATIAYSASREIRGSA